MRVMLAPDWVQRRVENHRGFEASINCPRLTAAPRHHARTHLSMPVSRSSSPALAATTG